MLDITGKSKEKHLSNLVANYSRALKPGLLDCLRNNKQKLEDACCPKCIYVAELHVEAIEEVLSSR